MTARAHPPFDVELEPALEAAPAFFTTLNPNAISAFRAATAHPPSLDDLIVGRPVEITDHSVSSYDGGEITVTVLQRSDHQKAAAGPGIYLIPGGGMGGGRRL